MIKNVVFDMGNVLARFDIYTHAARFTDDPDLQRLLVERVFRSVEWAQMDRGTLTVEEGARKLEAAVPESIRSFAKRYVLEWYDHFTPMPGMEALVAELKQAGYGIYLLSNAAENVYAYVPKLPVFSYFDGKFFSADYGVLKPSPQIYQKFLEVFSLRAEECFFIDDMNSNIEGAIHEGFMGFVYRFDTEELRQALQNAGVSV
ncbi:HAD family phosphatase [Christensenellaceae bacterium OttesenSCG-928-L17]|nr:HAD family phosphatase [Christensenellaceae bacterium OttesenSCG-928-L17]